MAALIRSPAVTLAVLAISACIACTASYGGLVGGRSRIHDVKANKEVQDLGRFSVEEHNRMLRQAQKEEEQVTFVEVVEAQQQVVSGIKYYMKILATQLQGGDGGDSRIFESVVVVKPWLPSKQLLNFAPSTQ